MSTAGCEGKCCEKEAETETALSLLLQSEKLGRQFCFQFPNVRRGRLANVLFGELSAPRQPLIDCQSIPFAIHRRRMR